MSSVGYILLLLVFVFYVYAIAGYYLFSANDPGHFGQISVAMISLFRTVSTCMRTYMHALAGPRAYI